MRYAGMIKNDIAAGEGVNVPSSPKVVPSIAKVVIILRPGTFLEAKNLQQIL